MRTTCCNLLLLLSPAACAAPRVALPAPVSGIHAPLLAPAAEPAASDRKDGPADETTLPVGFGFTTGPFSGLVATSLDFPLDDKVVFGPAVQMGLDSDVSLFTLTGQVRYFFDPVDDFLGSLKVQPYLSAGVGGARIDKSGRSSDTGFLISAGAGIRYLTGSKYRLGSEARLNLMPSDVAGEHAFLSLELLQVVINF